jgi:hypothetical protein
MMAPHCLAHERTARATETVHFLIAKNWRATLDEDAHYAHATAL